MADEEKNKELATVAGVGAILVAGGIGYYLYTKSKSIVSTTTTTSTTAIQITLSTTSFTYVG